MSAAIAQGGLGIFGFSFLFWFIVISVVAWLIIGIALYFYLIRPRDERDEIDQRMGDLYSMTDGENKVYATIIYVALGIALELLVWFAHKAASA